MILDNDLIFSDAQDLSQAAGTYVSTNALDNGAAQTAPGGYGTIRKDILRSGFLKVLIQVIEAFASGGSATLIVQLVQADDAALSSNVEILAQTRTLALAELAAGARIGLQATAGGLNQRYLGLRYVIGTATTTAGTITAGLVHDLDLGNAINDVV